MLVSWERARAHSTTQQQIQHDPRTQLYSSQFYQCTLNNARTTHKSSTEREYNELVWLMVCWLKRTKTNHAQFSAPFFHTRTASTGKRIQDNNSTKNGKRNICTHKDIHSRRMEYQNKRMKKNSNALHHRRGAVGNLFDSQSSSSNGGGSSTRAKRYKRRKKSQMNEKEWANEFNQKPIKNNNSSSSKTRIQKMYADARQFSKTQTKYAHQYTRTRTHTPIRPDCVSRKHRRQVHGLKHTWARERERAQKRKIVEHTKSTPPRRWCHCCCRPHITRGTPYTHAQPSTLCTNIQWCVDTETRQRHS